MNKFWLIEEDRKKRLLCEVQSNLYFHIEQSKEKR